jgi:hypothetical protein
MNVELIRKYELEISNNIANSKQIDEISKVTEIHVIYQFTKL